ncbi:hypothetical protein E3T23_02140 [Cryobacterium cheniae]|uniref:Uncharacterized protein n=1 Tax=Cryobacterium cheniae TaxID=1259262 RepID=A0A4V3IIS1_9MICO|nr:hypothetical protein [Cryobacterium cheniae]TFC83374.1 hypothetical protein E3T23_02140 [Cryobacterium cheniae]
MHENEIQSEYFVDPVYAAAALRALRALSNRLAPVLLVSELRTTATDSLWLSGASRQALFGIHFTRRNDPARVRVAVAEVEAALPDFSARAVHDHGRTRSDGT